MRITQKQQQMMSQIKMTSLQLATYQSLLKAQTTYPQLTKAQHDLFMSLYTQVKNNEKTWPNKKQ